MNLDTMLSKPGIYSIADFHVIFFVEVLPGGECHQLKPDTFERDGVLKREGWNLRGDEQIFGPLARPGVRDKLGELVLELADAVDNAAQDVGGSRPQLDILRDAVQIAQGQAPSVEAATVKITVKGPMTTIDVEWGDAIHELPPGEYPLMLGEGKQS